MKLKLLENVAIFTSKVHFQKTCFTHILLSFNQISHLERLVTSAKSEMKRNNKNKFFFLKLHFRYSDTQFKKADDV